MDNKQILAFKVICLGYKLPSCLKREKTRCYMRFTIEKKEVFYFFSIFDSQKDLDSYFQPIILE